MKVKHFALLFILMFAIVGYTCTDDGVSNVVSMAAGEGVGYSLNKYASGAVAGCEAEFDKLMRDTIGVDPIPTENMIRYYNASVAIITAEVKDPHLVIRRLSYIMTLLGAQYVDGSGAEMLTIQPVPRKLMLSFEFGYDTGKMQYEKEG